MRYTLEWKGQSFDPRTLTVAELEQIETIAGHGYGQVDPFARSGDFAALLTVFLLRGDDPDPELVLAEVTGATLSDMGDALRLVAEGV